MYNANMPPELQRIQAAIAALDDTVEPGDLRRLIDSMERKFCELVDAAARRGDHLLHGCSATSWVAETCRMSKHAAADRLCVGEQLRSLPRVAEALEGGRIGYQAAAIVCHLGDQLGPKRDHIDEEHWIGFAERFSVKDLRYLTYQARQAWDPDGFDMAGEEDNECRFLDLSPLGRMYRLDGMLDAEGGAALVAAIQALAHPLGSADSRRPRQRRADALVELAHHAMSSAAVPKRGGVRPHIAVTATAGALMGEVGAVSPQLHDGMPISTRTLQRLACDSTLCRVLKADSTVIDVGRATRSISGSQRRALNATHRTCCGPGCDRPVGMTSVHHVEFWGQGGESNLRNLVPLCYFHHRLVHEGEWQVVKSSDSIQWIPPERHLHRRTRAPGRYWAA